MKLNSKIFVAGHKGMVGGSLVRVLGRQGFKNIMTFSRKEYDLTSQDEVNHLFSIHQPEFVFIAAAKVGGIHANNTYRADFLYENLMIAANVIHSAYEFGVTKLLFLGSSCIYPKMAPQPLREEYLLSGYLESTNEPYAIAKIAGVKLCESYRAQYGCNFISAMPTNLFGLGDNYHPDNSHVIAGLIRKFHEAKVTDKDNVFVWGSGTPKREFLFADDLAEALVFMMQHYNDQAILNIGSGIEICISDLATLIAEIVGFSGKIIYDTTMPDGTPRKLLNSDRINRLGWSPKTSLKEGLYMAYQDFLQREQHH